MTQIVAVHSYRGGTGKSNLVANLAVLLAARGMRVGVIDTDIQAPGAHVLFGIDTAEDAPCLGDYLSNGCQIEEAARDLTGLACASPCPGALFVIPSHAPPSKIIDIVSRQYDVALLSSGFRRFAEVRGLDVLLLDTHPGMNNETVLALALADSVLIVTRPDHQEYRGAEVSVAVARTLNCPRVLVVVNMVSTGSASDALASRLPGAYAAEVAGVIPYHDDMADLASAGVLASHDPGHELVGHFGRVADRLLEAPVRPSALTECSPGERQVRGTRPPGAP
ncbi:MinD/ParA family ATP-binding protein [Actinorugispora endophytica]|uniref:MinD-like ATPase involved in chromosome partitioning or flagellar assembly n=1 Tax=Actinorugispora endophytica TaxID=1605990 RepID=A0A4R6UNY3_9ACTN|nr:MinD/ParA family protein [Actinorugispora endophytica]TDQ46905.1 MinD-like ATPase involved in chromosome partitioning or flagellar assembly [Actinorugispora endophytica]